MSELRRWLRVAKVSMREVEFGVEPEKEGFLTARTSLGMTCFFVA